MDTHAGTRLLLLVMLALLGNAAQAQKYRFAFRVEGCTDSVLYIGQHYRDEVHTVDTARLQKRNHEYVCTGTRRWERGVYTLLLQDAKTVISDFLVDDSRSFTLMLDLDAPYPGIDAKGSPANKLMFQYQSRLKQAFAEQDSLRLTGDQAAMQRLNDEMTAFEERIKKQAKGNLFFQLVELCENPQVPDSVQDKAYYFRSHYWDHLFAEVQSFDNALLHSPQLFSKLNYFFFGHLYHSKSDTIIAEIDRLMARIGDDTAAARYVLQFIEPRYYRATRNIGWDAVWCHLVERYYQQGRCPWAKESELYVMKKNYKRISQSIIGAHGQELWMLDTTQVDAPDHWHSSHRYPTRYVILWFWDPDCHHCQEQSAELKVLYDSLSAAHAKRFEVYAVGYDSDVDKWKRYVREHDFRWVNVGGPNVNIDYQEAYNVHGTPTMIILNERRDIIMNKVLPIKNLMAFLDEYEKTNH